MLQIQQMINENTPTRMSKRHLDKSPNGEDQPQKRLATGFIYDKEKYVFVNKGLKNDYYAQDRKDGVYKVNVRKINKSPINRIGFGKLMMNQKITEIHTIKKVSWNTLCVYFSKRENANLMMEKQDDFNKLGYELSIPIYYRSVVGVVRDIPVELTSKEIFELISENENILKIERMPRRLKNGHRDYSLNVKITFNLTELPRTVAICHGLERVHPYIAPVPFCTICFLYGHFAYSCKSQNKIRCSKCGGDHERKSCQAAQLTCIHCKGNHEATARECVERVRQQNVRILMSRNNMSFKEVLENFPIYTSKNQFDLLDNMNEFPQLHRDSYRDKLRGKKSSFVTRAPRRRRIHFSTHHRQETFSNHYSSLTLNTEPTRPLRENMHRVSDVERELTRTSQAMKTQTSFANEDSICYDDMNESNQSGNEQIINLNNTQLEVQTNNSEKNQI